MMFFLLGHILLVEQKPALTVSALVETRASLRSTQDNGKGQSSLARGIPLASSDQSMCVVGPERSDERHKRLQTSAPADGGDDPFHGEAAEAGRLGISYQEQCEGLDKLPSH